MYKGYERARLKVTKIQEKIANIRKDFLHKLSTCAVSENQAIALERLNILGMLNIKVTTAGGTAGGSPWRALASGY